MTDRTPEALRDFCMLMLGSERTTPLKPQGAEDIVNGATISALVEAFQATHPAQAAGAQPGKPVAAAGHDPLGLRSNGPPRCAYPSCTQYGTWRRPGEMPVCSAHRPPDAEPIS